MDMNPIPSSVMQRFPPEIWLMMLGHLYAETEWGCLAALGRTCRGLRLLVIGGIDRNRPPVRAAFETDSPLFMQGRTFPQRYSTRLAYLELAIRHRAYGLLWWLMENYSVQPVIVVNSLIDHGHYAVADRVDRKFLIYPDQDPGRRGSLHVFYKTFSGARHCALELWRITNLPAPQQNHRLGYVAKYLITMDDHQHRLVGDTLRMAPMHSLEMLTRELVRLNYGYPGEGIYAIDLTFYADRLDRVHMAAIDAETSGG